MPTTVQRVLDLLQTMQRTAGLEPLKRLFWTELNYDRANEPLSTRGWPQTAVEALCEPPVLLATHDGAAGAFHVIYGRQRAGLAIRDQRPAIEQLLREFPYALFVFSDRAQTHWHLVNVKYDRDHARRRVYRRITIGPEERLRTAAERIAMLDLASLAGWPSRPEPLAIQQRHDEAFDVRAVTREFFQVYRDVFEGAEAAVSGIDDPEERRLFTQKLFNRLMFIVFLERKGWLSFNGERGEYLRALWDDHRREVATDPAFSFYHHRLKLLFFSGLNTMHDVNIVGIRTKGVLARRIGDVPYLNGGLFEEDETDRDDGIHVPDEVIGRAIEDLFYRYNFTVTESTPLDVEVAVDPEMLGRIFEELVTGRHETGSYYTPKEIVQFMGREALKGYLASACPKETADALTRFVDEHDSTGIRDAEGVLAALQRVRACDPACGSGAYLLGMLRELFDLRQCLFRAQNLDPVSNYDRKLGIIQNNLYGVDVDPFAVNIARLRLWLSLIVEYNDGQPPPLPNLDFKIEVGDSITGPDPSGGLMADMFRQQEVDAYLRLKEEYLNAHESRKIELREAIAAQRRRIVEWTGIPDDEIGFDWMVDFAEVFAHAPDGNGGGFDIVITNPPYVRQEKIREQKPALKSIYGDRYKGTADLYVYFYFRALQLLRPGGVLCFISSNKWMRAAYGETLRQMLSQETRVRAVIDFGDLPVFGAIAYPCIVLVTKGEPSEEHLLRALTVDDLEAVERLADVVAARAWHQPQSAMRRDGWLLAPPEVQALLDKLRRRGLPLGEYVGGRIYYGIKTGLNAAFVIDRATRDRLVAEDPRSAEVIKPWLRGRDVKRWSVDWKGYYVIAIQNSGDGDAHNPWAQATSEDAARAIFRRTYPGIHDHLSRYEDALRVRQDQGRYWWELRACAYYAHLEQAKIIWPDIARRSEFALDRHSGYPDTTIFFIPADDLFLLGILNSSVALWHLMNVSSSIQQGFARFKRVYVEMLSIPDANPSQRSTLSGIARRLMEAQEGRGQEVSELEEKLNALVYETYGLTPEEVTLIEAELAHR